MSLLEAFVLGLVQGFTEFLPISSTAHLRILPALCGWPDPGAAFTAVTQVGTMIAVLVYFRRDVVRLVTAWVHGLIARAPFGDHDARMAWWIIAGTIPISITGLLFKDAIETGFRSLFVVAASLIVFSLILGIAERISTRDRSIGDLRFRDALWIGIAQAFALLPGASRSGTTITAGLFLNIKRKDAAEFSFLLSIPAVLLSGMYQLFELRHELTGALGVDILVAVLVSGIVGYASIAFLLRFLREHSTGIFIGYRIGLGLLMLALLAASVLPPL